jgi:hypothetical protein
LRSPEKLLIERFEVKRLVDDAVVANDVVEVALVLDAFTAVKLPTVVEPEAKIEAKFEVPVKVGPAENTSDPPTPVSSVISAPSSAEVSIEVLLTLLLNTVQSLFARYPFCDALATWIARVLPLKVSGEEMVVGITLPFALVERSAEGRPEIARAEVVPCPPEKKRFDEEAFCAKKLVLVPKVPANDWKVDDPEAKKLVAANCPVEVPLPVRKRVE